MSNHPARHELSDLDTALDWLRQVWEERPTPTQLHEHKLVDDKSLLGTPRFTERFERHLGSLATDRRVEWFRRDCDNVEPNCPRCHGQGRFAIKQTSWRSPLRRALHKLRYGTHEQWGPLPRRPWHPTPYEVVATLARGGFVWGRVEIRYINGQPVASDFAEIFALSAVRKLHRLYDAGFEETVSWTELSEAQRNALDAA